MAKRKISGIIKASEHPMGLDTQWNQLQPDGTYHAYDGDDIEAFLKTELTGRPAPVSEVAKGETAPAMSGAVFNELVGTVTDVDVRDSEDGTQYVMTVTQKDINGGETPKEVRFSKYSDDDKVVLSIDLTDATGAAMPPTQFLPIGKGMVVKYAVGVGTVGGSDVDGYTDLKARVIMKRGATVLGDFINAEFGGVTKGQTYTFDASKWLADASTYTIQVEAEALYQGTKLVRTASARITMVGMDLSTTYSVANGITDGGYATDVNIPFTIKGTTGEKNLYYRVNGGTAYTLPLSSGSGQQSRSVGISVQDLVPGLNAVEVYALHEQSNVMSRVYYINVLRATQPAKSYVGMMFGHRADGFQGDWRNPVMEAEQFTAWSFGYTAYDPDNHTATVTVKRDGATVKEDLIMRGLFGTYGETNVNVAPRLFALSCAGVEIPLRVNLNSHPDIEAQLAEDAVCSFDAFGRSNSEANADRWESGGKYMAFADVLWKVNEYGAGSGWHNDRLLLTNGAGMTLTSDDTDSEGNRIGYRPFNEGDKPVGFGIADVGMTIELEYSTANVTDVNAELITCLGQMPNGNRYGLVVTAEEAKFLTGVVTEAIDAGEIITYEDSVGTKFEPGKNIRITYVFYPDVPTNEQRTLIGFYVNGVESASSKWAGKVPFDIESELMFKSLGADLSVKNIRVYNKALTSDEVLNNYIVDRGHLEDTGEEKGVRTLDEDNRVMNEGDTVSMEKLMALMKKRKNSILVMIGSGSVGSEVPSDSDTLNVVDALAQLNDKKANKLVREIRFYNGEDRSLDFILRNVFVRIQGTSSVNYARKNFRFYFQKSAEGWTVTLDYGEIDANGNQSNPIHTEGKQNLFKLRKNSIGAKLACPKCDFSDSSMTTNTGGAKLINDGLKEMGMLTPAQRYAADHPDTCGVDVRSSIDGLPCDLFVAKDFGDDLIYYGQYNMNNEKSDSYPIFGQDKTIGGETWGEGDTLNYLEADTEGALGAPGEKHYLPITFETLNNSNPCCLFQWIPSTDPNHTDFMDNNFDGGLEFNHPKDVFWADGGGDAEEEPNLKDHLGTGDKYDMMYKATDRLMSFIHKCVKETTAGSKMTYNTVTHGFSGVDYADDGVKFPTAKWKSATFKRDAMKYLNVPSLISYYLYVDTNLGVDQLAKNMLVRTWDGIMWHITYYDGDCQLGSDNKSFLTGKYNDNRQTKRDGAFVMQGHNSWLWNLILANFRDLMEEIMVGGYNGGASFMSAFSIQKAIDHFDGLQMSRWCERLYNESGIFKYIYPFLNPMKVGADGAEQTYPQIYGMKGSLEQHRGYFIRRRYDLKQVEYGYVSTHGAQFYQSTASLDAGYVMKPMSYMLTIPYRVQLSTSNGVQADSGVVDAYQTYSLQLTKPFGENDPLKIIGAQKIRELVWHEDAFAIGFNFGLFTSLVKLDMSLAAPSGKRNGSFMTSTNGMLLLEELNMRNNLLARNGDSGSVATLDLSAQSRMRTLDLRGTGLAKVNLATGAPITVLKLPATLEELTLMNLPKLDDAGLVLEGYGKVMGYRFSSCPGVDGLALLEQLHQAKQGGMGQLERFELYVDIDATTALLDKYIDYKTYTTNGGYDNTHSGLKGRVRLDVYPDDHVLARYAAAYPELEIVLPEYTIIKHLEHVADGTGLSNLDNKTGYDYDNAYEPSGHVTKILAKRYRCLGKRSADGEETICKLHDSNSNYYADAVSVNLATPAILTGAEGDVWMYEPHYWYKGVNDFLNKAKYRLFSSLTNEPTKADSIKLMQEDLEVKTGFGVRVDTGYSTLQDAEADISSNSYYTVDVRGYRQVRFPAMASAIYGALFLDADGNIIGRMAVSSTVGFINGMYLFNSIPDNAAKLVFTVANNAPFDYVLLTRSEDLEAIEPDWVEHGECLTGLYEALVRDDILRSISGVQSSHSITQPDFKVYARNRGTGFQLVDWEMHKDVCNLFYAKYGNSDSQGTCGAGTSSTSRVTGASNATGMQDTKPTAKDGDPLPDIVDGSYKYADAFVLKTPGDEQRTAIGSPVCMGYENWYGNKYELINDTFNEGKVDYAMHVTMPDGSIRKVEGAHSGNSYPTNVLNGRYMDVWSALQGGSYTTYFYDNQSISNSTFRVVSRSGYYASAYGGVACASTSGDSTISSTSIGSRLAFRGKIVIAKSVAAFKAVIELA